jgi:dihydropyrimidinase
VPGGLAGIGALPHLIYNLFASAGRDGAGALATHLAENPARALGLYPRKGSLAVGADADLVLLSADNPSRPIQSSLADTYEPYEGFTSSLRIHHVVLRGEQVVGDGRLLDINHPRGRCLWES